ncbi:MAG TPA: VOC family protein [Acidimicrobiales bacterium]|nr:VOC family protein [Acidimicrobiales bacterium]
MSGHHEVLWLFHATAMVSDHDVAFDALARLAGLRVVYRVEAVQAGAGYRGGAVWIGDNSIELGEPVEAGSPVHRFVRRQGGGVHSLCVQVRDLDANTGHLDGEGVRHTPTFAPGFVFADPRDTGGVLFEFERAADSASAGVHPRAALAQPATGGPPLLDVTHLAFVGAVVDDPRRWAARYARLLDTSVTFEHPHAGPGGPMAGVSLVDNTLALFALPGEAGEALWSHGYGHPRTHVIGLRVPDLSTAADLLAGAGVNVARRDEQMIVIEPGATGGAGIVLVEELLPGDPRSGF